MDTGLVETIFAHKNIKGYVVEPYPYFTIWEQNIVAIIKKIGEIAIFLLFCNTKTLNMNNEK